MNESTIGEMSHDRIVETLREIKSEFLKLARDGHLGYRYAIATGYAIRAIGPAPQDEHTGLCKYCNQEHDLRVVCPAYVEFRDYLREERKRRREILFRKF